MKKSDLKSGMIVETRDGRWALVVKDNCCGEDAIIFSENNWANLDDFSESLEWYPHDKNMRDFTKSVDIMKVYKPDLPTGFLSRMCKFSEMRPIWERKEVPELTMEELVERIGFEFKLVK